MPRALGAAPWNIEIDRSILQDPDHVVPSGQGLPVVDVTAQSVLSYKDTTQPDPDCKRLADPFFQYMQSLNTPFPPVFKYKAYSKDNSSFLASVPEARHIAHGRNAAEKEVGEDCARGGRQKYD